MSQEEELAVLKEQHALLTRLLHQQQEVSLRHTRRLSCIFNFLLNVKLFYWFSSSSWKPDKLTCVH